ncbi:hypothetical protein AB0B97_28250 [Micromonospora sp. NPDC049004]
MRAYVLPDDPVRGSCAASGMDVLGADGVAVAVGPAGGGVVAVRGQ